MIIWSIVLCVLLVISVILFFQLLDKYGWNLKFKNLKPFYKFSLIYIIVFLLLWFGTYIYIISE